MSKKRICIAVADSKVEEWLMGEIIKKSGDYEFTKPALHRDVVIEKISYEKPNIVIISESLPIGGSSLSFDALIMTIRTKYQGCRIIIMAGNHEIGDAFLNKMVSRGVYDIVMGSTVDLNEIVDCVFNPRSYEYASKLQGLETSLDVNDTMDNVNMVEVVEKEKKGLFQRKNTDSSSPSQNPAPKTTSEQKSEPDKINGPAPVQEQSEQMVNENMGTSVLRTVNPGIDEGYDESIFSSHKTTPKGIIFQKVEYVAPVIPDKAQRFQKEPALNNSQANVQTNNNGYQNSPQNSYPSQSPSQNGAQTAAGFQDVFVQNSQTYSQNGSQNEGQVKNETSHPVTNSRVLTNEDSTFKQKPIVPANKFLPKIIAFVGARQGVGCTTALINTAVALAYSGKRVCVIDAVWNEKSIFDKLRIKHAANGFNNNPNYPLPPGFESSYAVVFPDKTDSGMIQFLEMMTGDIIPDGVLSNIRSFSGYNYILIDMTIGYFNPFSVGLVSLSDQIVAVTNQDAYELMILKNYLNAYATEVNNIYQKLYVFVNRSNRRLIPSDRDISQFMSSSDSPQGPDVFMFPCDNNGFITAASKDGVYINSCRKKPLKIFYEFVKRIS